MKQNREIRLHFLSSVLPALSFGALSGTAAGMCVTLYKLFAARAVALSGEMTALIREKLYFLPLFLALAAVAALFLAHIYQKEPDLKGGGIPTSVGALRGYFSVSPLKNTMGSFFLSLIAFLFGVPLGTEGPAVQLGTALGAGVAKATGKRPWKRFSMTGGACAAFATATGAPISGIFFAIEEAHGRISPLIVLTSVTAVLFAEIAAHIISPLLGVEVALFDLDVLPALSLKELYLPLAVGAAMGLFALLFFRFYSLLDRLFLKGKKLPQALLIFLIFALSVTVGIFVPEFVSTGHGLIHSLYHAPPSALFLLGILAVRSWLTLSATRCGITGGIFLPLLALGAAMGALLFRVIGAEQAGLPLFVSLAVVGCIAGMMNMPLTAVLFGVEALGLSENLVPLILTAALSFAIPASFGEESVGERVLERRRNERHRGRSLQREEFTMTVSKGAFAVGKEVRDIFWPHGVRVLSVEKKEAHHLLSEEDVLLLEMNTHRPEEAKAQLESILNTKKSV